MATDNAPPPPGEPTPVRIGDAERQRMTELLQRHMAAGRLDMAEYERRVEHATAAVYERDLDGLLDDLPPLDEDGDPVRPRHRDPRVPSDDGRPLGEESWWPPLGLGRGRSAWTGRGFPIPVLALGAIALVVASNGWVLFPLLFLFLFARGGGCGRRHHRPYGSRHHGECGSVDRDGVQDWGREDRPQWPGRFEPSGEDRRL